MSLVTLLTDFGTVDGFVGAMKGVIASLAPGATISDLTHDIPPHDVRAAARALKVATTTFPAGSIHVAVVDPGVGTERRPLLVLAAKRLYVVPDNGLASLVEGAEEACVIAVDRPELFRGSVCRTFHGRDVFASIAGHLASGNRSPTDCGEVTDDWLRLPNPVARVHDDEIVGVVTHFDRFGNLVTNIEAGHLARITPPTGGSPMACIVTCAGRAIPLRGTYADVPIGAWVAYIGSQDTIEVAVREGSAAHAGAVQQGSEVRLCRR